MTDLISEKLAQADAIVEASDVDVWLTFVRESSDSGEAVLPLILHGDVVWHSAFLVARGGRRVAILGSIDADPVRASGHWPTVVPYERGIRESLLQALEALCPAGQPRIAINYSTANEKADGLSHGMFLVLQEHLKGTRFERSLVSAEAIVTALRSRKTPTEVARIREAIRLTDGIFADVAREARSGWSERKVYEFVQGRIDDARLGYAWSRLGDPIVNSGPHSMVGHGVPSESIRLEPGHVFHIDLGVQKNGYCSDIQRCWFVPEPGKAGIPGEVLRATAAVAGAITAAASILRPGVEGWRVDAAARDFLTGAGYPEYPHALGHQVGRVAHDGGALLGPKWERYGHSPFMPIEKDQVFTLELGVMVEGRGYLGFEEMVVVTDAGIEWLTNRQTEMAILG